MPISEDTAALVAAQLTVAWATRIGIGKADPNRPFEGQVLETYLRLRDAVAERAIPKGGYTLENIS